MKKNTQRLSLNKETLRSLNEGQLAEAAGGDKSVQYSRCPDLSCGIACTYVNCTV